MMKSDDISLLFKERHYIGDYTPTCNRGQSEVKQSRQNSEAGQVVKIGIGGSLEMVKAF